MPVPIRWGVLLRDLSILCPPQSQGVLLVAQVAPFTFWYGIIVVGSSDLLSCYLALVL